MRPFKTNGPAGTDLEEFQVDGQIVLGILADGLDQVARFHQQVVSIVVQGRVLQELAGRALAFVEPVSNVVQTSDGVVDLARQLFIFGKLAQRAFAGIDTADQFVGLATALLALS